MMNEAFNTPWKVKNEVWRWISLPYIRLLFRINQIRWGANWKIFGVPIIQKHRQSTMRFGNGFSLRSSAGSNPLGINHPVILWTCEAKSILEIGENFGMTGGSICAADHITIGNEVNVGANSIIVDTDFHPLDSQGRRLHPQDGKTAPIVIEDDVFIGMNCLILKGVTIGKGSVIGAGSVVTKNIPPGVIAAGNPARVIRNL